MKFHSVSGILIITFSKDFHLIIIGMNNDSFLSKAFYMYIPNKLTNQYGIF